MISLGPSPFFSFPTLFYGHNSCCGLSPLKLFVYGFSETSGENEWEECTSGTRVILKVGGRCSALLLLHQDIVPG